MTFRRYVDIDWSAWIPEMRATLVFVLRDHQVLLIEKKRGLGAGKVNGPGGRLEPGETPLQAAIREVEEELVTTPHGLEEIGLLQFQFTDGLSIEGYVFTAAGCDREPRETDEAVPLWTPTDAIPYPRMWADDALWMPHLLAGRRFHGRFLFEDDTMLGHHLTVDGA